MTLTLVCKNPRYRLEGCTNITFSDVAYKLPSMKLQLSYLNDLAGLLRLLAAGNFFTWTRSLVSRIRVASALSLNGFSVETVESTRLISTTKLIPISRHLKGFRIYNQLFCCTRSLKSRDGPLSVTTDTKRKQLCVTCHQNQ